nr:glycosyltransferase family 1 protein [uncultured Undibacterium sp.]
MKIILSIEVILPPLAGIGRYAWELATRAPLHPDVESMRFMSDGRWTALPEMGQSASGSTQINAVSGPSFRTNLTSKLRQHLGRIPLVSRLYGQLMPKLVAGQLDKVDDAIFHGPNYFVPKTHLPTVLTIHDLSVYRFPQWHPSTRVERMLTTIPESIQRANLILTDSEAIRQELMQQFSLPAEKLKTVLLGVDPAYFPRTDQELLPVLNQFGLRAKEYALFVSTIEPRKNLTNLLVAYGALPDHLRQHFPLVLVGGRGWQSEAIHAEIERGVQQGWVKYLGYVEQHLLPYLYAGCRLFVYPSWYEGFGLPIVEAMASGVPVLTSNTSSMPEVAAGAALLVNPADVDQIKQGLQRGLEDHEWRTQAITLGLQRAAQLSWDACVQNTVAAYKTVSVR